MIVAVTRRTWVTVLSELRLGEIIGSHAERSPVAVVSLLPGGSVEPTRMLGSAYPTSSPPLHRPSRQLAADPTHVCITRPRNPSLRPSPPSHFSTPAPPPPHLNPRPLGPLLVQSSSLEWAFGAIEQFDLILQPMMLSSYWPSFGAIGLILGVVDRISVDTIGPILVWCH